MKYVLIIFSIMSVGLVGCKGGSKADAGKELDQVKKELDQAKKALEEAAKQTAEAAAADEKAKQQLDAADKLSNLNPSKNAKKSPDSKQPQIGKGVGGSENSITGNIAKQPPATPTGKLQQWTPDNLQRSFKGQSPKDIINSFGNPDHLSQEVKSGVGIFRYTYNNMKIADATTGSKYTRVTFLIYRYQTGKTVVDRAVVDPTSMVKVVRPVAQKPAAKKPTRTQFKARFLNRSSATLLRWKRPDTTSETVGGRGQTWRYGGLTRDPISGNDDDYIWVTIENGIVTEITFTAF